MSHTLTLAVMVLIGCCHIVAADEISLKDIWALDMPDTRDVRELEPEAFGEQLRSLPVEQQIDLQHRSLIGQIQEVLKRKDDAKFARGFVVSGTGLSALQAAKDVLIEKTKRSDALSSKAELTAVFFSRQSGSHVQVYQVVRDGNTIEIRYRFAPHDDAYMTEHLALIPLGKLPSGLYQVKVIRGPMEGKYIGAGFAEKGDADAERIVSRSFKFSVK